MSPRTPCLRAIIMTVGCASGVFGCSREPEEPARTVSWFQGHAEERKAMLAQCQDDPGRLREQPNCINATRAESIEGIGHYRDLPPLGLSAPTKNDDDAPDRSKVRP